MFEAGDVVYGYTYTDEGRIRVEGVVMCRTDDPEEMWQAYYIRTAEGEVHCCDEQEVWRTRQ